MTQRPIHVTGRLKETVRRTLLVKSMTFYDYEPAGPGVIRVTEYFGYDVRGMALHGVYAARRHYAQRLADGFVVYSQDDARRA